jgi:hypothetical protein
MPTSTWPARAAASSRAAALTTGPVTSSCPLGERPTAASPESMPMRTSRAGSSPSSTLRRRTRSRIASPARGPDRVVLVDLGQPKTAITASPMNFSGRPRSAISSSEATSKNRPSRSRARSASSRWARPVESTRSAKGRDHLPLLGLEERARRPAVRAEARPSERQTANRACANHRKQNMLLPQWRTLLSALSRVPLFEGCTRKELQFIARRTRSTSAPQTLIRRTSRQTPSHPAHGRVRGQGQR